MTSYDDDADIEIVHTMHFYDHLMEHEKSARFWHSPVVELVVIFKLLLLDVCLSIVEYILSILIT